MRSAAICRCARSRARRWLYQASAPSLRAEDDVADVEEDALVEHQPVAAPVGRHEADAAPGRVGRAARQAAAVGKDDLAGARLLACRTACRAGRDARALRARQGRRPRPAAAVNSTSRSWPPVRPLTTSLPRRSPAAAAAAAAGTAPPAGAPIIALDHLGDGERRHDPWSARRGRCG